jgi:hypothetical protein
MRKKLSSAGVAAVLILLSCNNTANETDVTDSPNIGSVVDTMPVIKPQVTDSSGIIKTPSVNDNNVVNPDTSKN